MLCGGCRLNIEAWHVHCQHWPDSGIVTHCAFVDTPHATAVISIRNNFHCRHHTLMHHLLVLLTSCAYLHHAAAPAANAHVMVSAERASRHTFSQRGSITSVYTWLTQPRIESHCIDDAAACHACRRPKSALANLGSCNYLLHPC